MERMEQGNVSAFSRTLKLEFCDYYLKKKRKQTGSGQVG